MFKTFRADLLSHPTNDVFNALHHDTVTNKWFIQWGYHQGIIPELKNEVDVAHVKSLGTRPGLQAIMDYVNTL